MRRLRALNADVGLHAANVIYRSALIRCFGIGILNAHIGLLPKYRGRSVMEWSILNGDPTGISTFLIDEGIDTGPIVLREEIPVAGAGAIPEAKRRLFSLDGDMYARALALLDEERFVPVRQDARGGTRWYPMSELFRGVVEELLRHGA